MQAIYWEKAILPLLQCSYKLPILNDTMKLQSMGEYMKKSDPASDFTYLFTFIAQEKGKYFSFHSEGLLTWRIPGLAQSLVGCCLIG